MPIRKSDLRKYSHDSCEYVVLHAKWRAQRGKKPSHNFGSLKNPRKVLDFVRRFAYFPVKGKYLAGVDISRYVCSSCGVSGCKLWRPYQTFNIELLCATCASKKEEKDISTLDATGRYESDFGKTDQIGWYVPAVLSEDTTDKAYVYWGYSAVPGPGVDWWRNLPTFPKEKAA